MVPEQVISFDDQWSCQQRNFVYKRQSTWKEKKNSFIYEFKCPPPNKSLQKPIFFIYQFKTWKTNIYKSQSFSSTSLKTWKTNIYKSQSFSSTNLNPEKEMFTIAKHLCLQTYKHF